MRSNAISEGYTPLASTRPREPNPVDIPLNPGWIILLMAEILHQLIGSLAHYLQGFIHPRWCRISAINSRDPYNGLL